eukprot:GEMP01044805.1.p1 GENE.GEMP01044805.1~~GEMP01044805.1.p1  ORF type:complete len:412 (+),score=90.94 GEMP01044805.1:124-1359(+)
MADSPVDNLMRMLERSHLRAQWELRSTDQPFAVCADSASTFTTRGCVPPQAMEVDDQLCPLRDCSNTLADRTDTADTAALPRATITHSVITVGRTTLPEPPFPNVLFGNLSVADNHQHSGQAAIPLQSHIIMEVNPIAANRQQECRIPPLFSTPRNIRSTAHADARVNITSFCAREEQHGIRDDDMSSHREADMSSPESRPPVDMVDQENTPPPAASREQEEPTEQQQEERQSAQDVMQDSTQVQRHVEAVSNVASHANRHSVRRGMRYCVQRTPERRRIRRGSVLKDWCAERLMHPLAVSNGTYSSLDLSHNEDSLRGRPLARMRVGRSRAQERRKACDRTPVWMKRRVSKLARRKRSLSSRSGSSSDSISSYRQQQAKKQCRLTCDYREQQEQRVAEPKSAPRDTQNSR